MADLIKIIVGAFALAYIGIQGYAMFVTGRIVDDLEYARLGPPDPLGDNLDIVNAAEGRNGRLKQGYVLWAAHDELREERIVRTQVFATTEALLKPGEDAPAPDLMDVFVSARAPAVASAECALLLATIARECKVEGSSGKLARDRSRYHEFTVTLSFAAKAKLGTYDATSRLAFNEIHVDRLGTQGTQAKGRQVRMSAAEAERRKLYREAARSCDEVRRREGNCALNAVVIHSTLRDDGGSLWMAGSADLAFVAPAGTS